MLLRQADIIIISVIMWSLSYHDNLRQKSRLQRSLSGIWWGWCWTLNRRTPKLCFRWTVQSEEKTDLDHPCGKKNKKQNETQTKHTQNPCDHEESERLKAHKRVDLIFLYRTMGLNVHLRYHLNKLLQSSVTVRWLFMFRKWLLQG